MTASIKRMSIDLTTFRRAVGIARQLAWRRRPAVGEARVEGAAAVGVRPADARTGAGATARLPRRQGRRPLRALASARLLLRRRWGDGGKDGGGDWTGTLDPGLSFFFFPTEVDYAVDYTQPFPGQFGPIPFQDPWWKLLLIIIAIILTIAAAVSGGADLVNQSDDAVIGTLTRSVLNALKTQPTTNPAATDPGSVDAAVVTLNGNRGLTPAMFTVLDAASDEASTTPIQRLAARSTRRARS